MKYSDKDDIYILSEEQIKAIDEARKQYLNGEYVSDDEAKRQIDEWLNKLDRE